MTRTVGQGGARDNPPGHDGTVSEHATGRAHRVPARLRVGVVGAGRVGAVLGAALRVAGHDVVAVSAVSEASRTRAEALLPGVPVRPADEVVADADLVLLAVPDDVLADLVAGLVATGALGEGRILVHTSGRHGLAPFDPAGALGVVGLALHPAMTFTGTSLDLERLRGCPFGITCAGDLRPVAEALVLEMGGEPVWVPDAERISYHAALAHGSNHLVTLVAQAMEILRGTGIEDPATMLRPLLSASLDNALRAGDAALTGPVARGDAGTVADHLAALTQESPDIRATYLALARATARRAGSAGRLPGPAADELRRVLDAADDDAGAGMGETSAP